MPDTSHENDEDVPLVGEDKGRYWAEHDERFDRMLERPSNRLMGAAAVESNSRVLDVGCGTGHSSRIVAQCANHGEVVGIDASPSMIAKARERARQEGLTNLRFIQADASTYRFEPASFDLAISQFGLMYFDDPGKAFANIASALKPGAPLVFLCWQYLTFNEYRMIDRRAFSAVMDEPMPSREGPGAYSMAEQPRVLRLLDEGGFHDVTFEDVHEQLMVGADPEDAVRFVTEDPTVKERLDALSPKDAERVIAEFRKSFAFRATDRGVWLGSAAWLVRARRKA